MKKKWKKSKKLNAMQQMETVNKYPLTQLDTRVYTSIKLTVAVVFIFIFNFIFIIVCFEFLNELLPAIKL